LIFDKSIIENRTFYYSDIKRYSMLSTAIIYFVVASQSYSELSQLTSQSSINKDTLSDITRTSNEMIFFMIVGIAYTLVGFWMIKRKYHSKIPYIVAIAGSAALIVFYIATRTVRILPSCTSSLVTSKDKILFFLISTATCIFRYPFLTCHL
jgi:cell division protein FtsW (lipid II flippase)